MNKVIQGDCLEVMKDIPDKSIDMILCDLPYGTTRNKWDSIISLNQMWTEYERIIKDNGAIVLTAQTPFDKILGTSKIELLRYEWIWIKQQGTGFLNSKKMPLKATENILVFYKNPPTYNPQMRTGFKPYTSKSGKGSSNYGEQVQVVTESNGERYPLNWIEVVYDKDKLHPTQKPIALFEYLIKTYTNEKDLVLDNCAGSGTTGVACKNLNRNYILIEKEPEYIDIINARLNI
jgi:site-specific DNA-methyltransferase (adenine-specific)